jgi:hypothetical protein
MLGTEDGTMRRRMTHDAIPGMLLVLVAMLAGCGSSGGREGAIGTAGTSAVVVQKGDPVLPAAPGYAGSRTCADCHPNQFEGWGKSLHNAPLKTVAELGDRIFVNDVDGNGVNDFQDGLDLQTQPAFAAFGNNAPVLSFSGGKYLATIGDVTYEVQRTQGGNGFWKQRFHTRIGRSYYILPFQFNEKTVEYVQYNASHWYDGTTPRFTGPNTDNNLVPQFAALNNATDKKGTARSWENRCAGCHQTGLAVEAQTTNYGGTDVLEVVTGYSELNIGCENCHGPGATHAATRNPADIINPENFKALGVVGLRAGNLVCGSCHERGEGNAEFPGMSLPLEYPSRFVSGVVELPLPGDSIVDNTTGNPFAILNTASAYYGVPPLPFFTAYGGWYTGYDFPIYVASRQHHQQWPDIEQGPHSADVSGNTCWSCHDPHEAAGDHQVRDSVTVDSVTLSTKNDDNSLCLSCHAGDFGITVDDVQTGGAVVETAVLEHMGEQAVMGDAHIASLYDPEGTGVGRCSKCHMPKTSQSAIRTAIGLGNIKEGDIHAHTFNFLWPSVNTLIPGNGTEVASGCYAAGCHNDDPADPLYVEIIADWSVSGHADFTGEPFRHWDEDGAIPTSCAKCHSRPGFRDFATDEVVNEEAKLGTTVSCGTCHTEEGDGTTLWDRRDVNTALSPVTFPSGLTADMGNASNICMACHQGRSAKNTVDDAIAANPAGPFSFINIHYFAAAATLFGTDVKGGYEYDNNSNIGPRSYVGRFIHFSPTRDTCIECHMGTATDLLENNHTFFTKTSYCSTCHDPVVSNPSDPAHPFRDIRFSSTGTDFDGDGDAAEGIYFEIWDTLVPALLAEIQLYAGTVIGTNIAYDPVTYPYFFKDTNGNGIADPSEANFGNRYNLFDATLLKAAYNYQVVQKDPCGYIHNGMYVLQMLIDSIEDLGGDVSPYTRP